MRLKWPLRCKIYIIIVYLIKIIQFQIPVFRNHNLFLSSFMTYHRVCNKSNTTGVTSGAVTAYYLGAPEFTSGFSGIFVARWLIFFIVFCRLLLSLCNIFCCCYVIVCLYSIYGFVFPFWYLHIRFPFVLIAIWPFLHAWLIAWFVATVS